MNKVPLIALSILAASTLPAAHADAKKLPQTAYFKVFVTATQDITWKRDETIKSCAVVRLQGNGSSHVNLRTNGWQPVTAERLHGRVTFSFPGGTGSAPAAGTLERKGNQQGTTIVPPAPGACPQPYLTPEDCGFRAYPTGARLSLMWDRPDDWLSSDGPPPLVPSLHLGGPYVPDATQTMGYQNCIGVNDDYVLGVSTYPAPGYESGFGALSAARIFGKKKHFTVTGHLEKTTTNTEPSFATGSWVTQTSVYWTVRFTRLAHPGKSPQPVDPAPLT
jgi:hypothetical protein